MTLAPKRSFGRFGIKPANTTPASTWRSTRLRSAGLTDARLNADMPPSGAPPRVRPRLTAGGSQDKPPATASPWQNGFADRLLGSIRRECVDHMVVLRER